MYNMWDKEQWNGLLICRLNQLMSFATIPELAKWENPKSTNKANKHVLKALSETIPGSRVGEKSQDPQGVGGGGVLHIECPIGSWIGAGVEGGNTTYLSVWLILGFDTSPSTQK